MSKQKGLSGKIISLEDEKSKKITFQELEGILKNMFPTAVFINNLLGEPLTNAINIIDKSGKEHNGTYKGTWNNTQKISKGIGQILNPNGTDNYITLGDSDDFSFVNGSADTAFTIAGVIEVANTVDYHMILSKRSDATGIEAREYSFYIQSDETLYIDLFDESADVFCRRKTDGALSVGFHTYVITYSGVGGATAANGITIYVDGVVVASTATNNASYVAMENLTTACLIGAYTGAGGTITGFITEDFTPPIIDKGTAWTAAQINSYHQLMKEIYNL